ncbi:MAG: hypothetical protein ACKVPX_14340 [Myxococcaceae bacterium]
MFAPLMVAMLVSHAPTGRWHRVGALEFNFPVEWRAVAKEANTVRFDMMGAGYALVDVQDVASGVTPEACRDRVVEKFLDRGNWNKKPLGGFAGASQILGEFAPNVSQYRDDYNPELPRDGHSNYEKILRVARYVGCDGKHAWSIVFTNATEHAEQTYVIDAIARAVENVRDVSQPSQTTVAVSAAATPVPTPVPTSEAALWHDVGPLQMQLPANWKRTVEPDSVARFELPGVGYMIVDAAVVQRKQPSAKTCREKILRALPDADGWTRTKIGRFQSAAHTATDASEEGERAETLRYVGCDGKHTWSLTFVHLPDGRQSAQARKTADLALKSLRCGTPKQVADFQVP